MYILIKNGENIIKYDSNNIELVKDGIKVGDITYKITIEKSPTNPNSFDIFVSFEDFQKILKGK